MLEEYQVKTTIFIGIYKIFNQMCTQFCVPFVKSFDFIHTLFHANNVLKD